MFKNLSNFASILKQAQQMGGQMQEMAGHLRSKRVTGSAGGGMIEVEANGVGEVVKLRIDPTLEDREMIEDLIPAAVNQALTKAKQLHVEAMQSMTEGMQLPGLDDALSQLTNGLSGDPDDAPSGSAPS